MIRAAIYARVSTSNGQTVANQVEALQEVAARQGWRVVAEHLDEGISGTRGRERRPGLDALMLAVTRREVDLVAAWSVDRLGRSLQDLVGFLEHLRVAGCDLYLHQQGLDTRTAAGRALFGMLAVFAEFERALIVDRVKAGIARSRRDGTRSGRPHGRPPISRIMRAGIEADLAVGLGLRRIASSRGVSQSTVVRVRDRLAQKAVAG